MMKSFFSALLAMVPLVTILSTPAVARPTHENAASTFIAPAPRWVVYSDAWVPGTDRPPTAAQLKGFNVFILSFLLASGPADKVLEFTELDAATRSSIITDYHNNGISLMVSAFGSTDAPTSNGQDPTALAHKISSFVKTYSLDGVDVDYEDFNAINSGTGSAEAWLTTFTKVLRADLPAGQYIITHAPVAPWFTDSTSLYPHGAYKGVYATAGSAIDWFNVQFYNQGNDYTGCTDLLTTSESDFPHTSVFEINSHAGVPLNKIVIGKPATTGDADGGFISASTLASCLATAKGKGWNGGAMFWEWPEASVSLIKTVRASSWPV